ncbi:hypothetical protein MMC09_003206 [Bachmanniomyces sp. S44760]|nr:hypothetical protein [Bachmanniomyces sp. S44760]
MAANSKGSINEATGLVEDTTFEGIDWQYPLENASLYGFLSALPQLDSNVTSKEPFNLETKSYGDHYGPAFYKHFHVQNMAIKNESTSETALEMNTLGILAMEAIQALYES